MEVTMKTKARLLKISVIVMILLMACSVTAYANIYGGSILTTEGLPKETGLYWELDSEAKILTISGNGSMPDYNSGSAAPYTGSVNGRYIGPLSETLHVEEGVARIGDYAFTCRGSSNVTTSYCVNLTKAYIASSVRSIGKNALNISNLNEVYILSEDISIEDSAIYRGATIYGYAGTSVEEYANKNGNPFVAICREHTETLVNAIEPTCTEDGYTGDVKCTVCGMVISEGEIVPALGHENTVVNRVEPTCTENGFSGDTVCGRCGIIIKAGTVISKLGHNMGTWQLSQSPACERDGMKIRFCERCSYQEVETIPQLGHDWGDWTITTEPTCGSEGCETRICKHDSTHIETRSVPAAGNHSWNNGVITKQPTPLEPGTKTYTCTVCGETKTEEIPKLNNVGWQLIDGNWYYYENDGTMRVNAWAKDSKGWVWLDTSGKITKNKWIKDSGKWYYLQNDGYMAASKWVKTVGYWYYLKSDGVMAVNEWTKDSKGWMWMDANGKITKNKWIKDRGKWYYLQNDGYMAASKWIKSGGYWYYMKSGGQMAASEWIKSGDYWYYLNASGHMLTGTHSINGKSYTFDSSGRWIG